MADHAALEDKVHNGGSRSRGGGGGNSRGGKRGGRGGQPRDVQVSKAFSKLLRHQAENAGISLDDEGYAPLDKVVSSPNFKTHICFLLVSSCRFFSLFLFSLFYLYSYFVLLFNIIVVSFANCFS